MCGELLCCVLKHKISRETLPVAFNGLYQHTGLDIVELRKISIDHTL